MSELKHYLVYLITNTVNGKIYVGQHQTYDVDDGYMGSGYALTAAYKKYGMDKFVKTILADFDDFDSMNNMESVIVDKEFVARKDTYNESVGGTKGWQSINELRKATPELEPWRRQRQLEGYRRAMQNPEIRERMRQARIRAKKTQQSKPPPWLGRRHTKDQLRKQHETYVRTGHQQGKKNSQYGTHWWKDPNDKTKSLSIKEGDPVPEGWVRGRWPNPNVRIGRHFVKITDGTQIKQVEYLVSPYEIDLLPGWQYIINQRRAPHPRQWITDGKINRLLNRQEEVPCGWKIGRTQKNSRRC